MCVCVRVFEWNKQCEQKQKKNNNTNDDTRLRKYISSRAAVRNIYDQRNLVFGKQRTSVDAFVIAQLWLRLYTVLYLQYTYQQIDFFDRMKFSEPR